MIVLDQVLPGKRAAVRRSHGDKPVEPTATDGLRAMRCAPAVLRCCRAGLVLLMVISAFGATPEEALADELRKIGLNPVARAFGAARAGVLPAVNASRRRWFLALRGNRFPRVARPSTVSAHGRCPRPPRLPPAVVG